MAALSDRDRQHGTIKAIGGDADTHRRLVDMGLIGSRYTVKARRNEAMLVDYGDFSAVTRVELARRIEVE